MQEVEELKRGNMCFAVSQGLKQLPSVQTSKKIHVSLLSRLKFITEQSKLDNHSPWYLKKSAHMVLIFLKKNKKPKNQGIFIRVLSGTQTALISL